jgi:site-specific recombinase XerD
LEQIVLTQNHINTFHRYLEEEEKSSATIEKYLRDVRKFYAFTEQRGISKELVVAYKQSLLFEKYAVRSINSMLASVNCFLKFIGLQECRVKQLKLQREVFCPEEKELTRNEYQRLVEAAGDNQKMRLIIQTICATGIRVSELKYFTVECIRKGTVTVSCKGKLRTVFLPGILKKQLMIYASRHNIHNGSVFVTRNGKALDRSYIWTQMKKLCVQAEVNPTKVFPHNLRKLFAKSFYEVEKDIVELADVLGHSNIETTRIYIISSGIEHRRKIDQLKLVL